MKKILYLTSLLCISVSLLQAQNNKIYRLSSPDGRIAVAVAVGQMISYTVVHDGDTLLAPSGVSMTLADGSTFGIAPKVQRASTRSVNDVIPARVYKKIAVPDVYNELTLKCRGDYQLLFRAYDDGVAYRFVSTAAKPFQVAAEQAEFNFAADVPAFIPYVRKGTEGHFERQFGTSFENTYTYSLLSAWDRSRYAFLPLLVDAGKGKKIGITEADLLNYPGMYLYNDAGGHALKGVFAPLPKEVEQGGHNRLQGIVKSRENVLAKYDRGVSFPWRILIISVADRQLADNDMVYRLASPTVAMDFSWVRPGKVAWDWWADWNIYGVDFVAGINNDTYKYYIDFAARYGIEYVILDEGWAVNRQADLFQIVPAIDLPALAAYAAERRVGLILWAGYHAFNRDMERVCRTYAEMGVKGFKVDFMDRDDQLMVDFHRRAAETAAKHKLLIDFHGTYKPTGLQRTYPNVVNFEGVHGLEQLKWGSEEIDQVTYDVTIPFIRMLAGPFDYTQGAMRNATRANYRSVGTEPMSQGTRCRQLAEYVVFESPLTMLCDNPSNYEREETCTRFIATVPTVWDETVALDGEVGHYVAIARRKGNQWYIGAMTDWTPRTLEIPTAFLHGTDGAQYRVTILQDGLNAHRHAADYKLVETTIAKGAPLTASMAPGGGWTAVLTPIE
ncbi:MAG: glycoside hydrolase family 97 protein [Prevotellaceae bacterium]|jgi:alpha-glucosidase|nr:glycoside hydrolase family 97 protein [Prevotellaceae bacterium]